jgi:ubiquinone/menaquinone biosynthesis C-methylase UbiE
VTQPEETSQDFDTVRRRYQRWLAAMHRPAHARRIAEREAAFALPYLKPGMRLLDCGCGPGSITIGLSAAVAPGAAVGIDIRPDNVQLANANAEAAGLANLTFRRADIYELPFDDGSFDAVFIHAVLQHLGDPAAAVAEAYRVVAPGGLIALGDADLAGFLIHPNSPGLERWAQLAVELRGHDGGSPHAGSRLRHLLAEAGCSRTVAGATARSPEAIAEVRMSAAWNAAYAAAPEFADYVTGTGLIQREELETVASAWRDWGESPGAFMATFWCHAVGWKD